MITAILIVCAVAALFAAFGTALTYWDHRRLWKVVVDVRGLVSSIADLTHAGSERDEANTELLRTIEQLAIDGEEFARGNRLGLKSLEVGVEHLLRALRPDLAHQLVEELRREAIAARLPRALEEERVSLETRAPSSDGSSRADG